MPSQPAAASTRRAALTASHGYRTAQPGTARIMARSSSAIWDGPSSPIDTPACDPASLMFICPMPAIRTKSDARVRKAANVEGNGMAPRLASPIAAPTMACSAI